MDEFSLIDVFFRQRALARPDVLFGIGDDAACLRVPEGYDLLVSTDTLVAGVHFLNEWDAFDIAWRAVMVNVSDMAAMAADPCWVSLALTMPDLDSCWLERFAEGLHAALAETGVSLIGGDTTRGPLCITLTVHGLVPSGQAVRRAGARPGDLVWVSGSLGASAFAVSLLRDHDIDPGDWSVLLNTLKRPRPRVDLTSLLRRYASSAIDISDGLSADLNHLCLAGKTGACLTQTAIPIHPLVKKYQPNLALAFALGGGDDYELCFTSPLSYREQIIAETEAAGQPCHPVGVIEQMPGLRMINEENVVEMLQPKGYSHF